MVALPPHTLNLIPERGAVDAATFATDIVAKNQPVVLRGQVKQWPVVAAAAQGHEAVARYISSFDNGRPTEAMIGAPEIKGRLFYSDDLRGFNFERKKVPLRILLNSLIQLLDDPNPPSLYAGSASAEDHLPGWAAANPLDLPTPGGSPRVWIGNQTHIAAHYDWGHNIACVAAGQRRFTLFPPDQIGNMYIGPLDFTMAGPPASLVNLGAPDLERYPLYAKALEAALVADLEPGDAVFIPSLWWHNVRSYGPLNVLVNTWWNEQPGPAPFDALIHSLMSLRDLPRAERETWRIWFEHYVFGDEASHVADHIPEYARGPLSAPSPSRTQIIKQYLLGALSRR